MKPVAFKVIGNALSRHGGKMTGKERAVVFPIRQFIKSKADNTSGFPLTEALP